MRTWAGWAAAAFVAAGCGGSMWGSDGAGASPGPRGPDQGGDGTPDQGGDERTGPPVVCSACKVTGGGQIRIGGSRREVSLQAIPEPGTAGAGGVAATGRVQLHDVSCDDDKIDLQVDAILGCRREGGELVATVGTREGFEVTVVDGGEPADDRISFRGLLSDGQAPIVSGNLQVHDLEGCVPAGEGGTAGGGTGDGTGGDGTGGSTGGDGTGGDGTPTDGGGTGGDGGGGFVPL